MHHVHHDLIVAWAKGAKIVFWNTRTQEWEDSSTPQWTNSTKYKIKPEPTPDIIKYGLAAPCMVAFNTNGKICNCNLMLIFDGETGKLKDAQVLVSSGE